MQDSELRDDYVLVKYKLRFNIRDENPEFTQVYRSKTWGEMSTIIEDILLAVGKDYLVSCFQYRGAYKQHTTVVAVTGLGGTPSTPLRETEEKNTFVRNMVSLCKHMGKAHEAAPYETPSTIGEVPPQSEK